MVTPPCQREATHRVEIRGERFNGGLEAFDGFQAILEETGGEEKQRACMLDVRLFEGRRLGRM